LHSILHTHTHTHTHTYQPNLTLSTSSMLYLTLILPLYLCIPVYSYNTDNCFQKNTVYSPGHFFSEKTLPSVESCQKSCQLLRICKHFSYHHDSSTCYLRQGNRPIPKVGITSGPKFCDGGREEPVMEKPCNASICLHGGDHSSEGDIFIDGLPVCDDSWGLREGTVACRQLGFPGVSEVTVGSDHKTQATNYSMDDVHCLGNETSLLDCHHKKSNNCGKSEAAGVVCTALSVNLPERCYQPRTVCVYGGFEEGKGNLYYGGLPVCDNGFDTLDAFVACRSMGFIGVKNATRGSRFGLGNSYFAMSNLDCRGHEGGLEECMHSIRSAGCSQFSVAGVICSEKAEPIVEQNSIIYPLTIGIGLLSASVIMLIIFILVKRDSPLLKKLGSYSVNTAPIMRMSRRRLSTDTLVRNEEVTEAVNSVYDVMHNKNIDNDVMHNQNINNV